MRESRSVVRLLGITGAISSRIPEAGRYDIQGLFRKLPAESFGCCGENLFPDGMNLEELKRVRSINASLDDVGYDSMMEKFLKNIISRKTFNFFRNE